jgi:hypothetical protein
LNLIRVRLPMQVVLTKRARSLSLFDEKDTRPVLASSLPAFSAGKFKTTNQHSAQARMPAERTHMRARRHALLLNHRVRCASRLRALSARAATQKENQCQES